MMFRTARRLLCTLSLGLVAGCAGGSSSAPTTPNPAHGGHMFALPDDRGFVEIKSDREPASRGSRKPATGARIMAYFYMPDGTTRMTPAPSEVKIKMGTDANSSSVALAPQPKDAALYASEPGPYSEGLRGELEAKINGDPVRVPFLFR
jgi:hypothetical protein